MMPSCPSRSLFVPVLLFLLFIPSFTAIGSVYGNGNTRSGPGVYGWAGLVNVTGNDHEHQFAKIAFDSNDDIHMVFTRQPDELVYIRMSSEHEIIQGPIIIASTNAGWDYWPQIALDSKDRVHIFYQDELPGDPPTIYYRHTVKDIFGDFKRYNNSGGDGILIDDDDIVYAFKYYRYLGASPPPYAGPLMLYKYDRMGNTLWEREIGLHLIDKCAADFALTPEGDIITVNLVNGTTANLTRVTSAGVITPVSVDLGHPENGEWMDVAITLDDNNTAHIIVSEFDDWTYEYWGWHHTVDLDRDEIISSEMLMDPDDIHRPGVDLTGPDHSGMMLVYYATGPDAGIPEAERDITHLAKFFNTEGTVISTDEITSACPAIYGSTALNHSQSFYFALAARQCRDMGQPVGDLSDIAYYYTSPRPPNTFDLSIPIENVTYPQDLLQGSIFYISATVFNKARNRSGPFTVEVNYSDTGDPINNFRFESLWGQESMTFNFELLIMNATDISIRVIPNEKEQDTDLTNNWANVTIVPIMRPDVRIVEDEIVVDPATPQVGHDEVYIRIPVENSGDLNAIAELDLGSFKESPIPLDLPAHSTVLVYVTWNGLEAGLITGDIEVINITPEEVPGKEVDNTAHIEFFVTANTPPWVNITSPVTDTIVDTTLTVKGNFFDLDGDEVELIISFNGRDLDNAPEINGNVFSFGLDLSAEGKGQYDITVTGSDGFNCTSDTITILLEEPDLKAKITDHYPKEDPVRLLLSERVEFGIHTWSNLGSPFEYEWFVDGEVIPGAGRNSWSYCALPESEPGDHVIKVVAATADIALTHEWNLIVGELNGIPFFLDPSPSNKTLILDRAGEGWLNLTVGDPDNDHMEVDLYLDGVLVKEMDHVGPDNTRISYIVKGEDVCPGRHYMMIVASDGEANVSFIFTIIVSSEGEHRSDEPVWPFLIILVIMAFVISLLVVLILLQRRTSETRGLKSRPGEEYRP